MDQEITTVTAGDIARLVAVGRAAVSNWRRRYVDFPKPVGGTASSPLYSLPEVEDWLRRNGKSFSVSLADRVWQRLRTAAGDLRLGELVCRAGLLLLGHAARDQVPAGPPLNVPLDDPELAGPLAELTEQRGALATFEFLCTRYQEAHSRQLAETPADLANLLVRLVGSGQDAGHGTLLDPACGLGGLLIAGTPARAFGQDSDPTSACIAAIRLLLRGVHTTIATGDALRHNEFPDDPVDAVVCAPPASERAWGHADLTEDPRWTYGVPPRGEPELAWVQHCLARVRPGGLVALLLPAAVAGRRPGRRIRGNLLRAGALRAVLSIAPGGPDLWLLRHPEPGEPPPAQVLLCAADGDLAAAESAWRAYRHDPDGRVAGAVRIIDLLDEDIDLTPARHTATQAGTDFAARYTAAVREFRAAAPELPELTVLDGDELAHRQSRPTITIGELVKAGALTVEHTTGAELLPGDVVAARTGETRVVARPGDTLAPQLTRYRVDPHRLDPEFLAGILRSAASRLPSGSSRIDLRRTPLPRLPLEEQRAYGRAFTALVAVAEHARATATLADRLAGLGLAGLVDGHLSPGTP